MTVTAAPVALAGALIWRGLFGAAVLALAVLAGVVIGEVPLPLQTVAAVLANKLWNAGHAVDPVEAGIIWNYRLPRVLVAAACGAGLALSGVVLQALIRNALADPYLLGVSAGASTGAVAVTILGVGGGAGRRPAPLRAPSSPLPSSRRWRGRQAAVLRSWCWPGSPGRSCSTR